MAVPAFSGSDEAFTADALFAAYAGGSADAVRALVQARRAARCSPAPGLLCRGRPLGATARCAAARRRCAPNPRPGRGARANGPQAKQAFRQLDASVGRLALKLPVGEMAPQAAAVRVAPCVRRARLAPAFALHAAVAARLPRSPRAQLDRLGSADLGALRTSIHPRPLTHPTPPSPQPLAFPTPPPGEGPDGRRRRRGPAGQRGGRAHVRPAPGSSREGAAPRRRGRFGAPPPAARICAGRAPDPWTFVRGAPPVL
jgi:hypothetical protein